MAARTGAGRPAIRRWATSSPSRRTPRSPGGSRRNAKGGNYGSGNGSPQPYDRGSITGPGPYSGFAASMGQGLPQGPCQRPPWGRLTAVNVATGEFAWQIHAGRHRRTAAGKAEHRTRRIGRTDRDGRRPGLHRHDVRRTLPRHRLEDRQGTVRHAAERDRQRDADDLPGAQRQAIRPAGGRRHSQRLRAAVKDGVRS